MVEPLQEGDIINIREYKQGKSLVEVSRIKEIINHILEGINEQSFQANLCGDKSTHSVLEDLKNNIEVGFGVLFDTQSPNQCKPSREAVKDKPPQVIQHESQSAEKSVGVSYSRPIHKKPYLRNIQSYVCSQCGEDGIFYGMSFCGGCGRKIKWEDKK